MVLSFVSKRFFIVASLFMLLIVMLGTIGAANPPNTLPSGMSIDRLALNGLTVDRAKQAWELYEQGRLQDTILLYHKEVEPHEYQFTYEELGIAANIQTLLDDLDTFQQASGWNKWNAWWQMRNRSYLVTWSLAEAKLSESVTQAWQHLESQQPQNARREITQQDEVRYDEGNSVSRIDFPQLKHQLLMHMAMTEQHDSIPLPLRIVEPEVTIEQLKKQGIERKISEFTTRFRQSNIGRVHNIQSTAETVNDALLAPGEIFDYEEFVKKTEQAYGYKPAPVILNGQFVQGVGGGICQVSTTLYNAALRSGLEIVERRHHSIPVEYVPLGQDATFASGYINFRFRNTLDSHLLIRTETGKGHITVKLFGSQDPKRQYVIESERVTHLPSPIRYIADSSLKSQQQVVLKKGKDGFVVRTTRKHMYDGKHVKEEQISEDRYAPTPTVVAMRNPPKEQLYRPGSPNGRVVEDGIQ